MASPVPNNRKGISESLRVRALAADARLEVLYDMLRDIERTDGLAGRTFQWIADQLNARGSKTRGNRGPDGEYVPKDWNGPRVAEALKKFGLNRKLVESWREDAKGWAFEHNVGEGRMLRQLWHEWLWHEKALLVEGQGLTKWGGKAVAFNPEPLFRHPDEWIAPWDRYADHPANIVPEAPPSARIVYLWLGAFTIEDERQI